MCGICCTYCHKGKCSRKSCTELDTISVEVYKRSIEDAIMQVTGTVKGGQSHRPVLYVRRMVIKFVDLRPDMTLGSFLLCSRVEVQALSPRYFIIDPLVLDT